MPIEDESSWVTDEELAGLKLEREIVRAASPVEQARKILGEYSPAAAIQMCKLALYSENDNIRLRASQYILDKTAYGETALDGAGRDPWDEMYKVLQEAATSGEYHRKPPGSMGPPKRD